MTAPCATCKGSRVLTLPHGGADDFDMIDRPCPTCRPEEWPDGFPGLAFHYADRSVWSIDPTGTYADRTPEDSRRASGMPPL